VTETLALGGLDITFDASVLRPRPWTMEQAAWAARLVEDAPEGPVLELCSGAGHIGLAFARLVPRRLVMVDADPSAYRFSRENAHAAGLADRVDVRLGDMRAVLTEGERFAFVLADPPYLPSSDTAMFPEDPLSAVDGGADGLAVVRLCLDVMERHLLPGGGAVLQVRDTEQAAAVDGYLEGHRRSRLSVASLREVDGRGALVRLRTV
jgi:methylase of polypeptide subunit release factors